MYTKAKRLRFLTVIFQLFVWGNATAGKVTAVTDSGKIREIDAFDKSIDKFAGTILAKDWTDYLTVRGRLAKASNISAIVVWQKSGDVQTSLKLLDEPIGELRVFAGLPSSRGEFKKTYQREATASEMSEMNSFADRFAHEACGAEDLLLKARPVKTFFSDLRSTQKTASELLKEHAAARKKTSHDLIIAHYDGRKFRFHDGSEINPTDLGSRSWLIGCSTMTCAGAGVRTSRQISANDAISVAKDVREVYVYGGAKSLRDVVSKVTQKYGYLTVISGVTLIFVLSGGSDGQEGS